MRTRGWWTVEPAEVAEIVENYGQLVLGDNGELMVEFEDQTGIEDLSGALEAKFQEQVFLAP